MTAFLRAEQHAACSEEALNEIHAHKALQVGDPGVPVTGAGLPRIMKSKDESALFKSALRAGMRYAEGRGAVQFETTDSASDKALYVYRLLVHDRLIAPMPEDQVGERTIRQRLASWYAHLPAGHPLVE